MQKLLLLTTVFSMSAAAVITLSVLVFFKDLPEPLPLFYSLPWGERQLASHAQFLIIPATIVLIALVNLIVSHQLHPSQSFLKIALHLVSLVAAVVLIITFMKIIFIFL
ncbi:hypothetical protein HYU96_00265 [Candidatus Daviesbacteria bacterium]|nr:hypothetical protein [Candidatus Daviesbacteria bacterium]